MGGRGSAGEGGVWGARTQAKYYIDRAPALTGTEKQVAQANDIRQQYINDELSHMIRRMTPHRIQRLGMEEATRRVKSQEDSILIVAESITSAGAWIRHRNAGRTDYGSMYSLVENVSSDLQDGISLKEIRRRLNNPL